MLNRFLQDDRGVMAAEFALLLVLACGCMAILSFTIGDRVSRAIAQATQVISDEVTMIKRGG
ncbi:hypothetical protein KRR38_05090 [Novosphingobium sp. G106]|uniref:hypothetical protein n=1 Tax=Novosphingobium sp. G106 TaxID=2849500 RepID=UPI001C2DC6FA|nr:hypothetical protein [Novosphingobium sp. G106]MBV1687064.1 hypothetical protein [Novosphingobium sp. G106]